MNLTIMKITPPIFRYLRQTFQVKNGDSRKIMKKIIIIINIISKFNITQISINQRLSEIQLNPFKHKMEETYANKISKLSFNVTTISSLCNETVARRVPSNESPTSSIQQIILILNNRLLKMCVSGCLP